MFAHATALEIKHTCVQTTGSLTCLTVNHLSGWLQALIYCSRSRITSACRSYFICAQNSVIYRSESSVLFCHVSCFLLWAVLHVQVWLLYYIHIVIQEIHFCHLHFVCRINEQHHKYLMCSGMSWAIPYGSLCLTWNKKIEFSYHHHS